MVDISKYRLYLAKGKSLALVRECQKMMKERKDQMMALAKDVGAKNCVTSYSVAGFVFDGDAPEGWKRKGSVDGASYYAPERRKKADRELWDRMRALRPVRAEDFAALLGRGMVFTDESGGHRGGAIMRCTTFQTVGEQIIILVPIHDKDEAPPPDSVPLKASDYWLMREQAEAA